MTDPMPERCATCAFRPGTEAALSPNTRLKAKLCALALMPFECHERQGPPAHACAGWEEACNRLYAGGHYSRQTEWQRNVQLGGLEAIEELETAAREGREPNVERAFLEELRRLVEGSEDAAPGQNQPKES